MAVNRILYFYLLLLAFLFFVLFDVYLFHLLFVFLLLLPLVTLLAALPVRRAVRCRMEPDDEIVPKGRCTLRLSAENAGFLPCVCVRMHLHYRSILGHTGGKYIEDMEDVVQFPLGARQTRTLLPSVKTGCCGRVDFSVARFDIFDMLGLIRLPVPKGNVLCGEGSVYILPTLQNRAIQIEEAADLGHDSSTYSTAKPGGDPSEIFQLRDYQAGDAKHSVHWKLSSRMQRLIVRDFGLPLNPSLHFLLSLPADTKPASAEYMLSTALAFSEYLMAREVVHHISWLSDDGLIHTATITGADALAVAMHELLAMPGQPRWHTLLQFIEQTAPQPETHLLYLSAGICSRPTPEAEQALSRMLDLHFCRKITLMPGRCTQETTDALHALGCEVQLLNGRIPEAAQEAAL